MAERGLNSYVGMRAQTERQLCAIVLGQAADRCEICRPRDLKMIQKIAIAEIMVRGKAQNLGHTGAKGHDLPNAINLNKKRTKFR